MLKDVSECRGMLSGMLKSASHTRYIFCVVVACWQCKEAQDGTIRVGAVAVQELERSWSNNGKQA